MIKVSRFLLVGLGLVAAIGSAPVRAQITSGTFDLELLLSGSYQPATTFAQLSVTPLGGNPGDTAFSEYQFTLTALGLNTIFTNGAFIGALAVNTVPDRDGPPPPISANPVINVAGGGGISSITGSSGPNVGGIGWDWIFNFPTSGQGGGALRLTDGESVTWSAEWDYDFAFLTDPYLLGTNAFVVHVQGLTDAQGGSAWYTPPIPEPEIYAMLLAGLGLMGFVANRRRQTQAAA